MTEFPKSASRQALKDVYQYLGEARVAEVLTNRNDYEIVRYWIESKEHTMGRTGERFGTDYMGVKKALARSYHRLKVAAEELSDTRNQVHACAVHNLEPAGIRCSTGAKIERCRHCHALFQRPVRDND